MHVPLETLRRAAQLLDSLEDVDQPTEAPHLLLPGLAELVGCDALTYNEIEAAPDQLSYYADYPVGCMDPADREEFEAHLHEHPVLRHFRATGDRERQDDHQEDGREPLEREDRRPVNRRELHGKTLLPASDLVNGYLLMVRARGYVPSGD